MEKYWYKVNAFRGHMGAGKEATVPIFIFAKDVISVLDTYKTIPGIKKQISTTKFPDVYKLNINESLVLEEYIKRKGHVSLERAKEKWFIMR